MKKFLALFLAIVILFSLVACGSAQSQDIPESADNAAAEAGAKENYTAENIGKEDDAEAEPDSSVASVTYEEIDSKIEEEVETKIAALESEMEALSTKIDNYDSYVDNVELVISL